MEGAEGSEEAFYLRNASAVSDLKKSAELTITDDSKDDYQYEEVPVDDEFSLEEDDEDLLEALQMTEKQAEDAPVLAQQSVQTSEKSVLGTAEAMDDYICNFLYRCGMSRTLNCFQAEWYEFIVRGLIKTEDTGLVPPVYVRNQQLEGENTLLRKELRSYTLALSKAKKTILKLQQKYNFLEMHHRRVIQERNRLICSMQSGHKQSSTEERLGKSHPAGRESLILKGINMVQSKKMGK